MYYKSWLIANLGCHYLAESRGLPYLSGTPVTGGLQAFNA